MSTICKAAQEAIAWNRALDAGVREHLVHCESCQALLAGVTFLDAVILQGIDGDVPADFAERVMMRVADARHVGVHSHLAPLLRDRRLQVAFLNVGMLVSLSNLFRFMLSLLVPNTAWGGE